MKEQNKKKILLRLFLSTLYLSAFTFGGGYVIVTLMKKKFVDECHWIEENEMLDLVATVFIYLISERIYFWWGICDRYTDEEKICRSISLDRRK